MAVLISFQKLLFLFYFIGGVISSPLNRRQTSLYAPIQHSCPFTPLVRPANEISFPEQVYFLERKLLANIALELWLLKIDPGFIALELPSVGLATSGGGLRSTLEGAGVIQAFDARDSNSSVSGLYQALTYHSALSGGSLLLSSLAASNWATVSSLKTSLWDTSFANFPSTADQAEIVNDLTAKAAAGFVPTLTDVFGRILSFGLFTGSDGGAANTLSGLTKKSNFVARFVPYPIITAIQLAAGQCIPGAANPQFELHPYEFGSWDSGIAAFTQTAYLGTNMTNGNPTTPGACVKNYDNLGYVLATSSDTFSLTCQTLPSPSSSNILIADLEGLLEPLHAGDFRDEFSVYPNPFYSYPESPTVQSLTELNLEDGGFSLQNDPIWPFIQPARSPYINVLLVNDNSADTEYNFPDGSEIYQTYLRAQQVGLTRMPTIPQPSVFASEGLTKRATFFGCHDKTKLTIVYLPNVAYDYPSNQSTSKILYTADETDGMIANGVKIGTQNGDAEWPTCLACAIMMDVALVMPEACEACFEKHCFIS